MKEGENKFKIMNTALVVVIALVFLSWVIFRILFPVFNFTYGKDTNNIFTTLSVGNKKYLEVKIPDNYPFHKFLMKVTLDKMDDNSFGGVYQNEVGLYPIKGNISNKNELMNYLSISKNKNVLNGELISKNEAVYFISEGTYRAFLNADVFNKLGFDWDKIRKNTGREFNHLVKGASIDEMVAYLPSSFVRIEDELYLLDGKSRRRINNNDLIKFIENKFSVIKVQPNRLLSVGKVQCKKTLFGKKEKCFFRANGDQIFSKAKLIVEQTNSEASVDEGSIKIDTFDRFFNSVVPKITIFNVKNSIKSNYGEDIGRLNF
jgi:hypothetical protein